MKKLLTALCLCCTPLMVVGCSEQTQQEASEAAQQTGEALESAAEDAAEATENAAGEVKDALDGDNSGTEQ
jgi:outer membrane lipoprotein-sorting protein